MTTRMSTGSRTASVLTWALVATCAAACSGADDQVSAAEAARDATDTHSTAAESEQAEHGVDRETAESLAVARAATSGFHRVEDASAAGFALPPAPAPLNECIVAADGQAATGLHYINGTNVEDTVLDPARPEALVYEPTENGRLRLVAAEYVVFADAWDAEHPGETPQLFGRDLALVPEPNQYELPAFFQIHAWIWKHNPNGMHDDHNPRVTCDHAG